MSTRAQAAVKATAALKVDGTEYSLVYDYNAIADAEKVAGCNLLGGLVSLSTVSAAQLRGLFYAALQGHHRFSPARGKTPAAGLNLEQAGAMIRPDTVIRIAEAVAAAYVLSIPNPPEAEAEPAKDT